MADILVNGIHKISAFKLKNMNKYILVLILALILNFSYAQQSEGIVFYKKEYLNLRSSDKDFITKYKNNPDFIKKVEEIDLGTIEMLSQIQFELVYNSSESIFKAQDLLQLENNKFSGFAIGPEGSTVYYINQMENVNIQQIDAYGEVFLVKYPKTEWELINETKKIGKYTCYKAVTRYTVKGRKGIMKRSVEAWYCPEISIPYGPLGFSGLPGLIIELTAHNYKYYVSKIELNNEKEIVVKKPTKGKKVSKIEFEEIGIKTMNEFKKGY